LPRDLLESEIRAQLPQVRAAYLAEPLAPVAVSDAAATAAPTTALVVVTVERALSARERATLARWLALRLEREEVIVIDHLVRAARSR
jgi:hypothetical protein